MNAAAPVAPTERIVITPDSHNHWLELRSQNVSSTESSALYDLNKYTTHFELYHAKKAGGIRQIEETFRMKAGNVLEPAIAELAAGVLGVKVRPFKDYIYLPESRMGASFDFITEDGDLMEIKNVDGWIYKQEWTEDTAPDHIEVQVQHCMHVAGISKCYIVALVGGNDLKIIERDYNPKVGAALERKIVKFWQAVEAGNEPDIDWSRDAQFVLEVNSGAGSPAIEGTDEIRDLAQQYKEHKAAEAAAKSEADAVKAQIFEMIGTADAVVGEDFKLTTSRTKDTEPKIITVTEAMVGEQITLSKGRKGYRQFKANFKGAAK